MKLWIKKLLIFVIAGFVYTFGQYFRGVWFLNSGLPNTCGHAIFNGIPFCDSPYLDTLGWPLITLGEVLAVVAVIMLFANERGLRKWFRFSLVYLPLAAVLSIYLSSLRLPLGPTIQLWGPVRFFGIIYALVTAGIVLYARVRRPDPVPRAAP